ncbi:MAG: lysophospholipid acyltransferase family protein [Fimbriimonadales bacterium]
MFYKWVAYPLTKLILTVGLFLLGPVKVRGKQNIPRAGGLLVIANHLSDCDPPVMGYAMPRHAHYMAKSELFDIPILSWIIRTLRAFPVNRGSPDRAAIRRTVELLQAGDVVVVFPEGQLSEDGGLQPLMPGVAMFVARSGASVICAGLVGTSKIIPFKKVWPRPAFGGVSITFGEPKSFEHGASSEEILGWMKSQLIELTLDSSRPDRVK